MNRIESQSAGATRTTTVPTAPILITEHEVLLGTAAAAAASPGALHWWSIVGGVVRAAIQQISRRSTADARPPIQHRPTFCGFLEQSCMVREMRRL